MREEVRDRGRLEHMLTAIENVEEFTENISLEEVHGYYTVSPEKVWETVQNDLPILKKQIESLLEE